VEVTCRRCERSESLAVILPKRTNPTKQHDLPSRPCASSCNSCSLNSIRLFRRSTSTVYDSSHASHRTGASAFKPRSDVSRAPSLSEMMLFQICGVQTHLASEPDLRKLDVVKPTSGLPCPPALQCKEDSDNRSGMFLVIPSVSYDVAKRHRHSRSESIKESV
jgi:hypothetical protein